MISMKQKPPAGGSAGGGHKLTILLNERNFKEKLRRKYNFVNMPKEGLFLPFKPCLLCEIAFYSRML